MNTNPNKGSFLVEGKTKRIFAVEGDDSHIIIESKADITAYDDPSLTKQFDKKSIYATNTTCRVFELLAQAGIPVSYIRQLSPTEFLARKCRMLPLELVVRRLADGSYLKRSPQYKRADGLMRFHSLMTEFFLKTTSGTARDMNGKMIVQGLSAKKKEEDPLILDPRNEKWTLVHSKIPMWESGSVLRENIISPIHGLASIDTLEELMKKVFLLLEGAWNVLGYRLIDLKIEVGLDSDGNLLVADVIDNDSWRLRTQSGEELSKESFRQGESLDEVEAKYGRVSDLVNRFRVPRQCLVIWKGSEKDSFDVPTVYKDLGVDIVEVTASGHKETVKCLSTLERLLGKYPDGGAIIVKVGLSNGLGPILAAHSSWPVISIPATYDKFPDDIWSSMRMPSKLPMATVTRDSNAVDFAGKILAAKNPLVYAFQQLELEKLDP